MSSAAVEGPESAPQDELITTGAAARLLGTSRQHVVDLCLRGDLAYASVGAYRRLRRSDVEVFAAGSAAMTRDEQRSLWLNHGVAGKVVVDPGRARDGAIDGGSKR